MDDLLRTNLANWEARVAMHAASDEYGLARYLDDPDHISGVVRFDEPRLGDIRNLDVVHLQCHIGTDSLSLARLGARVTGVDFSPSALQVARDLAERAGPPVTYVEATVDDAVAALGTSFDLVYTGVGALCWLPSVRRWAEVVAALLRPGGRLFLREGHPMLWSLQDDRDDGLLVVDWPYFEAAGAQRETCEQSYAGQGSVAKPVTYEWNHGLGEIVQAVIDAGMTVTRLEEHDVIEWPALPGMVADPDREGCFRLPEAQAHMVPLMYTLEARRSD